MEIKLYDAELRVMDVLWNAGEATASQIAAALKERFDYSKTTTYTLIKRCVDKGAIRRGDPGFHCFPLVTRAQTQELEVGELIVKLYDGAADRLVASVLGNKKLSQAETLRLKQVISDWSDRN
jgi:predicted transcriptional regulator